MSLQFFYRWRRLAVLRLDLIASLLLALIGLGGPAHAPPKHSSDPQFKHLHNLIIPFVPEYEKKFAIIHLLLVNSIGGRVVGLQ